VDWVGRVSKWKHHAYEWLGVDKPEIAVMTELLLRGAQQLGELRARAARMEPIADLAALKPIVAGLIERGLMIELTPAGRGQVVSHNLYPPDELAELRSQVGGRRTSLDDESGAGQASPAPSPRTTAPASSDVTELRAEVARLEAEVHRLREMIYDLDTKLQATIGRIEGAGA
jgi:hypothetical protein